MCFLSSFGDVHRVGIVVTLGLKMLVPSNFFEREYGGTRSVCPYLHFLRVREYRGTRPVRP